MSADQLRSLREMQDLTADWIFHASTGDLVRVLLSVSNLHPRELLAAIEACGERLEVQLNLPDPAPGVSLSVTVPAGHEQMARDAAARAGIELQP